MSFLAVGMFGSCTDSDHNKWNPKDDVVTEVPEETLRKPIVKLVTYDSDSFTISWTAVEGAQYYEFSYGEVVMFYDNNGQPLESEPKISALVPANNPLFEAVTRQQVGTEFTLTVGDLLPGQSYMPRLRAVGRASEPNEEGIFMRIYSAWDNSVVVITDGLPLLNVRWEDWENWRWELEPDSTNFSIEARGFIGDLLAPYIPVVSDAAKTAQFNATFTRDSDDPTDQTIRGVRLNIQDPMIAGTPVPVEAIDLEALPDMILELLKSAGIDLTNIPGVTYVGPTIPNLTDEGLIAQINEYIDTETRLRSERYTYNQESITLFEMNADSAIPFPELPFWDMIKDLIGDAAGVAGGMGGIIDTPLEEITFLGASLVANPAKVDFSFYDQATKDRLKMEASVSIMMSLQTSESMINMFFIWGTMTDIKFTTSLVRRPL